jgi:uncharacterized protein (TIGR00369 family)
MEIQTHPKIDRKLCGEPRSLAEGGATVELLTTPEMAADERGLVHGGFVFGLADYAAMLAVNHPNVVLAGAEVKFLAPVVVGETVMAEAKVTQAEGKRQTVQVEVRRGGDLVFQGTFACATPSGHVLDKRR